MSPALGAVASVMKVFGGLGRILRLGDARPESEQASEREAQDDISRAAAEGKRRYCGSARRGYAI
jgi:hypothetical protein